MHLVPFVLLGLATASPLVAQLVPSSPRSLVDVDVTNALQENRSFPAFVTPIHSQADDPTGGAYGIWGAGRDYKVSFHDGMTWVPYLGAEYPVNQPLRWHTMSVTLGETPLGGGEPTARQVGDTRYEYVHAGFTEAYDVLLDGLEQTFVIPSAPVVGDLVVRGRLESALRAETCAARHGPVVFVDHNGDAILSYGAATAVDALGRRREMTTSHVDGTIELRLDADWLREAQFPVTVDPLLTPVTLGTTSTTLTGSFNACDVFRDDLRTSANVWIGYTRNVSFVDSDLWIMRTDDNLPGALVVQAFADITTSWGNDGCALAYANSRVIGAFGRVLTGPPATREIRWHAHHIDDLATRFGFGSFTASVNNWRIDIGGQLPTSTNGRAMVVFQHEVSASFVDGPTSEVRGFYVDLTGVTGTTSQGVAATPVTVLAGSLIDCERPRINQMADDGYFSVVHQNYNNGTAGDDWDVYVDFWGDAGNLLTYRLLEPDNGEHKLGPVVSGNGGRFLVTYAGVPLALDPTKTLSVVGYTVHVQRVDYDGVSALLPHPANVYLVSSVRNQEVMDSAFDYETRCHWMQLIHQSGSLFCDLLGFRGQMSTFGVVYSSASVSSYPSTGRITFDRNHDGFLMVTGVYSPGSFPLIGASWTTPPLATPSYQGFGCTSASLLWTSQPGQPISQRIGHQFGRVLVNGAPFNSVASTLISFANANVPLGGISPFGAGCTLLVDTVTPQYIGYFPPALVSPFGQVGWNLPLPEFLFTSTLRFQGIYLDPSSGVILMTQRMSVPIGY